MSNSSNRVQAITRTAILIALTVAFQSLGLQQMITGPVVNMFLYLAVLTTGMWAGVATGLITPFAALSFGILKPAMAPMVIPIAVSNSVMCILFALIGTAAPRSPRPWIKPGASARPGMRIIGILCASVAKFLVLAATVRFIVSLPPPMAAAMQGVQLVTAIAGGLLALAVYEILLRTGTFQSPKA